MESDTAVSPEQMPSPPNSPRPDSDRALSIGPKTESTNYSGLDHLRNLQFFDRMDGGSGGNYRGHGRGIPPSRGRSQSRGQQSQESSSLSQGSSSSRHPLPHPNPTQAHFDSLFQDPELDQILNRLPALEQPPHHAFVAPAHAPHLQHQHHHHHHQQSTHRHGSHHTQPPHNAPSQAPEFDINDLFQQWQQGLPTQQAAQSPTARSPSSSRPQTSRYNASGVPGPSTSSSLPPFVGHGPSPAGASMAGPVATSVASPTSGGLNFTPEEHAIIEEKRRRNTAASARFRLKKKARVHNMERTVSDLEGRTSELEKEARDLRQENNFLKDLIMHRARSRRGFGRGVPEIPGQSPAQDDEEEDEDDDGDEYYDEESAPGPSGSPGQPGPSGSPRRS